MDFKKKEWSLNGLRGVDKIKALLELSDMYETYYYMPKGLEKAFYHVNQALNLSQSLHSDIYIGKCYLQLSMLYQLSNNNAMIERYARNAIAMLSKTNQKDDLAEAWVMVWSAKMRIDAPMAEKFIPIRNAAALFKLSGNNKRCSDCYREIGELYYRYKDFPKAMTSLQKAVVLYKAANLEDDDFVSSVSLRLNVLYDTEKKNKDIIILKNKALLQQNELKTATFLRNSMITFMILLIIILGLLYKSYKFKKKTNRILEVQQEEINQKNTTLQSMLIEKEWLVREIHHRTKNNLHMVVGLLNSQSAYLDNEKALSAIRNSQHRIHSISLIHQKLYGTESIATINMPNYIKELVAYLKESFLLGQRIRFEVKVDPIELHVSQAVPLGLIINEAVTNSIKYAFPDDITGFIYVSLEASNDKYLLTISDNGIGIDIDFNKVKPGSFGMSLIKGLTDDLEGKFSLENNNGTILRIEFIPELPNAKDINSEIS
ncbi:sensor histidine kinase [uncultured Flavobacterium sp.]|uniref:sensor histidine kinase n=1 Tax=uncultured Flavobacterium sp. TaxID=165435 RepID=UPI003081E44B